MSKVFFLADSVLNKYKLDGYQVTEYKIQEPSIAVKLQSDMIKNTEFWVDAIGRLEERLDATDPGCFDIDKRNWYLIEIKDTQYVKRCILGRALFRTKYIVVRPTIIWTYTDARVFVNGRSNNMVFELNDKQKAEYEAWANDHKCTLEDRVDFRHDFVFCPGRDGSCVKSVVCCCGARLDFPIL